MTKLLRDPVFAAAAALLLLHVVLATFGTEIAPYAFDKMDFGSRLTRPDAAHWFGTDNYGRDVLSRVLVGGKITLQFGFGAVAVCFAIGLPVGLASAYFGGWVDQVLMRVMDVLMSFPTLLLGLLILIIAGPNIVNLILAVGLVYCPRTARMVRGAALAVRNSTYIEAAQARGEPPVYIMVRELLPSCAGPILVEFCIRLSYAILLGASFNYLGLGVQPPAADWGALVQEARSVMMLAPWTVIFPIVFISTLVAPLHLLGDRIDDWFKGDGRA
jgi:peptide/nickel transport system permease protein